MAGWRRDPDVLEAAWWEDLRWLVTLAAGSGTHPPAEEWLRLVHTYQQVIDRRLARIEALLRDLASGTNRVAGGNGREQEGLR